MEVFMQSSEIIYLLLFFSVKINVIYCCSVHSGYIWSSHNHNTHTPPLYTCLKPLIVPTCDIPFNKAEGKLLVLQSERWPLMAVTCSQRSWYKVDSDRRGKPKLSRVTPLACFCASCVALCERLSRELLRKPAHRLTCRAELQRRRALSSLLVVHLLNVCVFLGVFCLMFSDVITCSRLYSEVSHSPWLPPSGPNEELAACVPWPCSHPTAISHWLMFLTTC